MFKICYQSQILKKYFHFSSCIVCFNLTLSLHLCNHTQKNHWKEKRKEKKLFYSNALFKQINGFITYFSVNHISFEMRYRIQQFSSSEIFQDNCYLWVENNLFEISHMSWMQHACTYCDCKIQRCASQSFTCTFLPDFFYLHDMIFTKIN